MESFRFKQFPVYSQAKIFYKRTRTICNKLPSEWRALKDQLLRAALSVILNIAEGSAKKSDKEFARFLETSIASMNETVACLDLLCDERVISKELYLILEKEAESIIKQLGGFIKKLYIKC